MAAAYTAMREQVRTDPGGALSDTDQIRSLASALTADVLDAEAAEENRFEAVSQTTVRDVLDLLNTAAATLRDVVNDRDALIAARGWEHDTEAANGIAAPTPEDSARLLAELADTERDTGDLDRDALRGHVAWFHAVRNFTVHHQSDRQRSDQYRFDAFGVRPSMALIALHQLINAAEQGAQISADDLVWATRGPERLRGDYEAAPAEYTPPCLRRADSAS